MSHPFDDFSKSLSEDLVPRRESLRRLGAIFGGALVTPLIVGIEAVSAKDGEHPWKRRRHKSSNKTRRTGSAKNPCLEFCRCSNKTKQNQCLATCQSCNSDTSRLHGSCGTYVCCGVGQKYCKGRCVDIMTDNANCGACGRVCGSGKTCVNGACKSGSTMCPKGETKCGATCTNLASDTRNCGFCGNVCGSGAKCVNGACVGGTTPCPTGQNLCNNACVDLNSDNNNCGACNNGCPSGTVCVNGICDSGGNSDCPIGYTKCGGACVNLLVDNSNCGTCGNVCATWMGQTCVNGACTAISGCPGGIICNGVCTNVSVDTQNCGGCGIQCASGQTCTAGICEFVF